MFLMDKVFEIEALGHKYTARYCRYYDYYWLTSDTGYTFRMDPETFKQYLVGTEEEEWV